MNRLHNYARIFDLLGDGIEDSLTRVSRRVGKAGFISSTLAYIILTVVDIDMAAKEYDILISIIGFGFLVGILCFVIVGIHHAGLAGSRKTFFGALGYVLGKTFVYIFLPALVVTALVLAWAYFTNQPVFGTFK